MWAERALKIKHMFHQVCRSRASSVLFWDMGEDSQIWPRLRFCALDTDTRAKGQGCCTFKERLAGTLTPTNYFMDVLCNLQLKIKGRTWLDIQISVFAHRATAFSCNHAEFKCGTVIFNMSQLKGCIHKNSNWLGNPQGISTTGVKACI